VSLRTLEHSILTAPQFLLCNTINPLLSAPVSLPSGSEHTATPLPALAPAPDLAPLVKALQAENASLKCTNRRLKESLRDINEETAAAATAAAAERDLLQPPQSIGERLVALINEAGVYLTRYSYTILIYL
jgi:hypothetical protein